MNLAHSNTWTDNRRIMLPTLTATKGDRPDSEGWSNGATHWRCALSYQGRRMSVWYSMGSAHTGEPKVLDVVGSLVMDASCEDTFKDFCDSFGYDQDSRKAEKVWKACQSIKVRLHKLLGSDFDAIANRVREAGY